MVEARPALHDGAPDQSPPPQQGRGEQHGRRNGARTLPHQSHVVRVAPEACDVTLHKAQSLDGVQQTHVARDCAVVRSEETCAVHTAPTVTGHGAEHSASNRDKLTRIAPAGSASFARTSTYDLSVNILFLDAFILNKSEFCF